MAPKDRPRKITSIRYKLAFSIFSSFFLVTAAIIFFQQYRSYIQFEGYVKRTSEEALEIAIDSADKWMVHQMNLVDLMATKIERALFASPDPEAAFESFCRANHFKSVFVGLEDGRYIHALNPVFDERAGFRSKDWYRETLRRQTRTFIPPPQGIPADQAVLTFASPLKDETGWRTLGVVGYTVPMDTLKAVLASIFIADVDRLDILRDRKGRPSIIVKAKDMSDSDFKVLVSAFRDEDLLNHSVVTLNYNKYFVLFETLSTADLTLVYPISLTNLLTPLLVQAFGYFLVTLICLWLIAKLAWRMVEGFVRRIEKVNETTRKISEGNFDIYVKDTTHDEIGQLADSFNKMIASLKKYMTSLEITAREKEAISKELEIASRLQQNALPRNMPDESGIEVMARSLPAKAVGGDYYDFLYPEPDHLTCVIADVSGKGLPSSLFMFHTRSIFRTLSLNEKSPASILEKVNQQICRDASIADGMFITYVCGIYDARTRRFTYANAGHFPPIYYRAAEKSFRQTATSGIPIGILPDQTYPEESIDFRKGDILVFYTDGVIEAKNSQGRMFGVDPLMRLIEQNKDKSASGLFEAIQDAVKTFVAKEPQFDDMTLLVMKAK